MSLQGTAFPDGDRESNLFIKDCFTSIAMTVLDQYRVITKTTQDDNAICSQPITIDH